MVRKQNCSCNFMESGFHNSGSKLQNVSWHGPYTFVYSKVRKMSASMLLIHYYSKVKFNLLFIFQLIYDSFCESLVKNGYNSKIQDNLSTHKDFV